MPAYAEKRFLLIKDAKTYDAHEKRARSMGYELASITSNQELIDAMKVSNNMTVWIGAIRHGSGNGPGNDNWKWSSGESWSFTNWAPGEPNNHAGRENRVQMYPHGKWNDINEEWRGPAVYMMLGPRKLEGVFVPTKFDKWRGDGAHLNNPDVIRKNFLFFFEDVNGSGDSCNFTFKAPRVMQMNEAGSRAPLRRSGDGDKKFKYVGTAGEGNSLYDCVVEEVGFGGIKISLWGKQGEIVMFGARATGLEEVDGIEFGNENSLWNNLEGKRLVLEGQPEDCCCLPGRCWGFDSRMEQKIWFTELPQELEEKGLTQARWDEWMKKLKDVQRKSSSHDWIRLLTLCGLIFAPMLLLLSCQLKTSKCDPFQIAMKNWLDEFNKVLKPKGVYAKAFTFAEMGSGGGRGDGALSILCFALDSAEIDRLEKEPALQQGNSGDPNWGCWCLPAHEGRVL